jgi:hypothetical protein
MVDRLLNRLKTKRKEASRNDNDEQEEEPEDMDADDDEHEQEQEHEHEQEREHEHEQEREQDHAVPVPVSYQPGNYVVAIYQDDWYVGQVMEKEGEPDAEAGDEYLLLNFMKKMVPGDRLRWPQQKDVLNTLKEDILFCCQPPMPSASSSSSRSVTFSLSAEETKKAKAMLNDRTSKACYPTKFSWILISVVEPIS